MLRNDDPTRRPEWGGNDEGGPRMTMPRTAVHTERSELGDTPLYEKLADAFVAEGVDAVFGLLGDANMAWTTAMTQRAGVQVVHARHEAAAVTMADGYARRLGKVGVASVTCGPGLTQIATSLVTAVRHGTPLLVFAGDTPISAAHHVQEFDQRPFVESTGATFVPVRAEGAATAVAEAFAHARRAKTAVVLSVPFDLQHAGPTERWAYRPVAVAGVQPVAPDPAVSDHVSRLLAEARRPIVLAGRGAVDAGVRSEILTLAERVGALVGTTWRARGWFDDHPWDIGLVGGFGATLTQDLVLGADLVLAVGARLSRFTVADGRLTANATVVHLDREPQRTVEGVDVTDVEMRADAGLGLQSLLERIDASTNLTGYRTAEVRGDLDAPAPRPPRSGRTDVLDPYDAADEIQVAVPDDWPIVLGVAHFMHFSLERLRRRHPDRYLYTYDFGAIGHALGTAIGSAVATGTPTVCIEGDGSLLMNLQELETLGRHGLPVLVLVCNDGQYAAEVHKLRSMGLNPHEAVFGPPDLAGVARALGVDAHTVNEPGSLAAIVTGFARTRRPTLVDLRVDPDVVCRDYLRDLFPDEKEESQRVP